MGYITQIHMGCKQKAACENNKAQNFQNANPAYTQCRPEVACIEIFLNRTDRLKSQDFTTVKLLKPCFRLAINTQFADNAVKPSCVLGNPTGGTQLLALNGWPNNDPFSKPIFQS